MGRYDKNGFDFGSFEITKREVLASISIIAVMLLFGVLISEKISAQQADKNEIYNKAVKIESQELFQYAMDTNAGNAFIYGDLEAVDTVTYPEIGGEYMYVEKVKEQYTMHTRTVCEYDADGNMTGLHTETYWTWDRVGSEEKKCQVITFCGALFESNKINIPKADYIDTIQESGNTRYKYYGAGTKYTGTIFANLKDKTIPDNTDFYNEKNIEETVKCLEASGGLAGFWLLWIILISGCVYGFYYLDNKWLE